MNKFLIKWSYSQTVNGRRSNCENTITTCAVTDMENARIGIGQAQCHPEDYFTKEIGRKKSLANAIRNFPKNIRAEVWEQYRTMTKYPRWTKPNQDMEPASVFSSIQNY